MDTTTNPARQILLGSALIVLGAIGFSAKSILIKLAYADSAQIDAITLMTLRMLFALPFFLGIALWHDSAKFASHSLQDWGALLLLGVMGYYLASLLDFKGLEYISAGLERLILFLYPTFVVVLTALFYRRPIAGIQRMALVLSYAGIGLVYSAQPITTSPELPLGALLVFGSAFAFAIYMTASGHYIPRFGSRRFTAYSMSIACGVTIAHFLLSRPLSQLAVPPDVLALAVALALLSTVLPAFLMNAGIRRIGADRAAIIGTVGPVSTLLLAWLVLDEALTLLQLFGAALVLCGALLAGQTNRKTVS
ncbi:MAG TPA: EamA/RhaT family transporter [Gammaproteobacteria bacterium]|nr:EamA/RhaT family transporter [Gammaproteobacteria bacterium]